MTKRIPVAGPSITDLEIRYVSDAVTTNWFGRAGEYIGRFEEGFANHCGLAHAVSLPSCTSGIHLALAALGIGPGDEVIVPDTTWIATAAPISYVGASPVFADVDARTWCISPDSIERLVSPKTRAVIAVDLYGNMANYDAITKICHRHGLRLIEDAAEAAGATYRDRPAGSFGDVSVFSFHGSKTLTTGEGGMLLTNDTNLYNRVCFLRDHGRTPGDFSFQNSEVAFKYKMSSMQAALGLAQLERLSQLMEIKRRAFGWYRDRLGGVPGLALNEPGGEVNSSYWMVSAVWDASLGIDKKQLRDVLHEQSIDTRPFFSPLSSLQAYRSHANVVQCAARNKTAYQLKDYGINLPSSMLITEDEVEHVCRVVKSVFAGANHRISGTAH